MKKSFFVFLIMLIISGLAAQAQEWQWAKKTGGTGNDDGSDITVDDNGNTYVTGGFQNYILLGSTSLGSNGSSDIFVAKADVDGNWIWATRAGGTSNESGASICVDNNGNIYVTGRFQGTAIFGSTLLSATGDDIFVAKLDYNGIWLWAKRAGGASIDSGESISVDSNGNCYLTGGFQDTADFGSTSLTSFGPYYTNCFIAKLDTNGNWLWAQNSGIGHGKGIFSDSNGNSYVTGNYQSSWNLGAITLTSDGIFVAKLSTNGNCLWATRAGDSNDIVTDLSTDNTGNCYVTGNFAGVIDFGSISLASTGNRDGYIAKISSNGNWLWARPVEGPGEATGRDIAVDGVGNCFVTGSFAETAYFGSWSITNSGSYDDIFVCVLDPNGNWLKVSKAEGDGENRSNGIVTDGRGNSYITGFFRESIYFGSIPLNGTSTLDDIFVAKLSPPNPFLVTSNVINFGSGYLGYYEDNQDLILWNYGESGLLLTDMVFLSTNTPFEVISPSLPYTIDPNEFVIVHLRFTPQIAGNVSDDLNIYNNSLNMPLARIQLSGRGIIVPPKPPFNVIIDIVGNDVIIGWDAVTQSIFNTPMIPDYYFIYNANYLEGEFVLNGLTPNLSYTHPYITIGAQRMFYKVSAVKFYRSNMSPNELDSYLRASLKPGMTEAQVHSFLQANVFIYKKEEIPVANP